MSSPPERLSGPIDDRLRSVWLVFTMSWAIAVLFHIAGNTRLAPEWGRASLGLAAVALLTRPHSRALAAALAVAVLVNVWLEAPLLGNHWLLHGLIAVVVLGGVALARTPEDVVRRITGPLRLLLLAFYSFAAFAKLNTDFFDPVVSCGVFYFKESAASWGLGGLVGGWPTFAQRGLTILVAVTELAVPVLLLWRRTRRTGVVLALTFHFVLALDRTHQFFDFSAVLAVLFLLFLPGCGVVSVLDQLSRLRGRLARRRESTPELLRLLALAAAAGVVAIASGPGAWPAPPLLRAIGVAVWIIYGAGTILFAVKAARAATEPDGRLVPAGSSALLLIVPVVAVANGLTPYVEVKTGASWNMYSNLSVVEGRSNHLLVPGGLDVTDEHDRLVEVTDFEGVDLAFYVGTDWRLPEGMLLDHLADRPGAVVLGQVDGQRVRYEGGAAGARPLWQRKLQVFRAVDGEGPVGCQTSFGPAR